MQTHNLLLATLMLATGLLPGGAVLATEENGAVDCFYEANQAHPLCGAQPTADATAPERVTWAEESVAARPAVATENCHSCHTSARD
jgi:hypothetical protein